MKKLPTLIMGMALGTSLAAHADGGQVVTVKGEKVDKTVKQITFNNDQLTLTYADGSQQSVELEEVSIVFSETTAVTQLGTQPGDAAIGYFDLKGHQLEKAPAQGAYIMKRGDKVVKVLKQ
jgi:hypothetical protein